jgi:hypothetical protein
MLTNVQKNEIVALIESEKKRLGSAAAVAKKCKVSETAISQLTNGKYPTKGDDIYETIALALGYDFGGNNWNIAETTNFHIVSQVLNDAKTESMFMGISYKAGSGKTSTANVFYRENKHNGVFKIDCKEWAGHTFLTEIATQIGAEIPKGYAKTNVLIENIAAAVKKIARLRPLIILDQANSLKSSALRSLIHIFNECEDVLGLVIIGTENLEYEIKRGVRLNKAGYDELDSRFGRKYISLIGANLNDARKVCEANGITDRDLQKRIFDECEPTKTLLSDGRRIEVIEDMRRLKRVIKRERLNLCYEN